MSPSPDLAGRYNNETDFPYLEHNVSIAPYQPSFSPESPQRTIESPVDYIKQNMHDKTLFAHFILDEHGAIMEDESDDGHSQ